MHDNSELKQDLREVRAALSKLRVGLRGLQSLREALSDDERFAVNPGESYSDADVAIDSVSTAIGYTEALKNKIERVQRVWDR